MLQITARGRKLMRRLRRAERDGRHLASARRARLVSVVARYMRTEWETGRAPTKLTHEAGARHVLRAMLCLSGWGWADADAAALDVVAAALRQIGAKRPTWAEAQPEWTQAGGAAIERTRCARCGRALPEGHRLWCGDVCARAAKWDRQKRRLADARMPARG